MGVWYRFEAASEPELMAMVHSAMLERVSDMTRVPTSELRMAEVGRTSLDTATMTPLRTSPRVDAAVAAVVE
jgi:hypothetical protein